MRRRDRFAGVFVMNTAVSVVVRRVCNLANVDHRKQRKYQRLDERDEYAEQRKYKRQKKLRKRRIEICDLAKDLFIREHIRKKSNAERERPDHIRDQFYAEDQRSDDDR